jgi:hypothetical protein
MRRSLARFSDPESLAHTQSSADFIAIISGFRFSVHTPFERSSAPFGSSPMDRLKVSGNLVTVIIATIITLIVLGIVD